MSVGVGDSPFDLICKLERLGYHRRFATSSVSIWPLVRQCIWLCLINKHSPNSRHSLFSLIHQKLYLVLRKTLDIFLRRNQRASFVGPESVAFFSRPVYLHNTSLKVSIDRVVDPLVHCMPSGITFAKYYVSSIPIGICLKHKASLVKCSRSIGGATLSPCQIKSLIEISQIINIPSITLVQCCKDSLDLFSRWFSFGLKFFRGRTSLKTIFVTSWYFPDMMGLVAAARLFGIGSVDIQHGKQGKFQPMYSGWDIPEEGYDLMPDLFWCWGKKSADHILSSSPNRSNHRPVIGGYPWLDYYSRFLKAESSTFFTQFPVRVLFTLQPPTVENFRPIPDFVVDYLLSMPSNVFFVFRGHPNHKNAKQYCQQRLSLCSPSLYSIDDGSKPLYDLILSSTHHLTAFSSCCYEASEFGVPTLLYGDTARALYSNEIADDIFSWTSGDVDFLANWLRLVGANVKSTSYIESSMSLASEVLSSFVI